MGPIVVKEGIKGLRGETGADDASLMTDWGLTPDIQYWLSVPTKPDKPIRNNLPFNSARKAKLLTIHVRRN